MQRTLANIQIVYTESDSGIADSIAAALREKLSGGAAPQATAIVIVSDAATKDGEWQAQIAALNKGVRLIPVGQTINADYSDPKVIPPAVEELNFIRVDDNLVDNLWESITIGADFYEIRNNVLVNMDAWLTSKKSDAFLLNGWRAARKSLRVVRRQLEAETDDRAREQLQSMESYLEASRKKAGRMLLRTTRHRALVGVLAAFSVWLVFTTANILGYMQRASDEMALLGVEHTESNAFENVVRLLDGVDNPLIDKATRSRFMAEMTGYLDMNWCTTPIGLNYKHELTDAQLIDDRYVQTATDNGLMLVWDTYNGTIKDKLELSNVGLRALQANPENNVVVAVTDENKVLFGIGSEWLSNGNALPFVDGDRINVTLDKRHALVSDSQHVYVYELSDGGVRPASYITPETMTYDKYTIHSAALFDGGFAVAFHADDAMHFAVFSDAGDKAYGMGVDVLATCQAAARENRMVFSDAEGNLLLFDAQDGEVSPIGLQLPDPRTICFINDTTIVYSDGLLGTRLYDFEGHIDLGSAFTGIEGIDALTSNGTTLMCHAGGLYQCQPIETMLPLREINEKDVVARYDKKVDASDGQIASIATYTDHTVQYDERRDGKTRSVIIDGGHYLDVGSAITDYAGSPAGVDRFKFEPFHFEGKPTVVGIIDNGYGFVLGAEDGTFRECVLRTNGSLIPEGSFRAPSHAAITAVLEMKDCYYLLDEAGYYWKARLSYPSGETGSTLMLDQINAKLHHGVTKELYDSVSEQTRQDMDMHVMPGGDGKEWE